MNNNFKRRRPPSVKTDLGV